MSLPLDSRRARNRLLTRCVFRSWCWAYSHLKWNYADAPDQYKPAECGVRVRFQLHRFSLSLHHLLTSLLFP